VARQAEHASLSTLHSEDERCLSELQKTREAYRQRVAEEQALRLRLEADKGAAQQTAQQLALLQAQCNPKAVEAKLEAACAQRVAATELEGRKRTDEAVRTGRALKAKLEAQAQLEAQLGTLRHKLEVRRQCGGSSPRPPRCHAALLPTIPPTVLPTVLPTILPTVLPAVPPTALTLPS